MIGTRPASRPRRLVSAATLAFVLWTAAALAGAAVPALAAKAKRGGHAKVVILAPQRDARVTGKTLEVRVRASSRTFRANVSGTDVTSRFHRHGGLLEATLRRGRDYQLGENLLAVTVGKGERTLPATVPFVSLKRAKGLLKVTKLAAHGARPLRFRIRTAAPVAGLKVSVDGRRYPLGATAGRRAWTLAIGASDGAHFGANTIVVTAEREGSRRFDRERLGFRIGRGSPLAGAGADQTTRPGKAVVLRGGSTIAGDKRGALIYRWKIVKKPAGSHARIANGTKVNARLLPDLPGSYQVQLTAARVSKRTAAKEAASRATASATEAAAKPTCLQDVPLPLTSAGNGSVEPGGGARTSVGPFLPLSPLEAPPCVTPIGEPTPPPLPLEATRSMSVDETHLTALPTETPMGWAIETLAEDGSIRVGPQIFPKKSGWVHMVVLDQKKLIPAEPEGDFSVNDEVFQLNEGAELLKDVEATNDKQVVILSGMGEAQPPQAPLAAQEDLAKAIAYLSAPEPEVDDRAEIVESGRWSVVGTHKEPGVTYTNLHGLGEQAVEGMPGTLPGSINGWMQNVLSDGGYAYLSPEEIPIDTKAEGSSNTVSVFQVGGETVSSTPIVPGSLALHIAAFDLDQPNGEPKVVGNYTDVIDDPKVATNEAGVRAAAEQLQLWRVEEANVLLVMQTFGEETVGQNTAPWSSKYWVNDALIPDNARGLLEWDKQPYLKAKNEAELAQKQDARWNPGYPTVAGQVGDLTGEVGHDLVSILGGGNTKKVEVTRLTMVAENHPESTESSYIDGYAAPSPGRLNGVLVRNARGGLKVENGSAMPISTEESFRELIFDGGPTPWKYETGKENEAVLEYIAEELWPRERFRTPREAYVKKLGDEWNREETQVGRLKYPQGEGFSKATFEAVKEQIEIEMSDLDAVQKAIGNWRKLFGEEKVTSLVNAEKIGAKVVEQVEREAKQKPKDEAEVNPQEVISEALYIVGDLSGFPEDTEFLKFPEIISMVASAMGLAEAAAPEEPEEAEGPNANLIRAKGTGLGVALFEHFEDVSKMLGHFETIIASDPRKLEKAASEAPGGWTYDGETEQQLLQSLAIGTEQVLYEALLPMAYTQWVIAPYQTAFMPNGPEVPGNNYVCRHWHEGRTADVKPFAGEPEQALDTAVYRPFNLPGSAAFPARGSTVPFTIRALKSDADPMEVDRVELTETTAGIEIHHGGGNPPERLLEGLFQAPKGELHANFPKRLGINKSAFFAGYGEGPTEWKRVICAQG